MKISRETKIVIIIFTISAFVFGSIFSIDIKNPFVFMMFGSVLIFGINCLFIIFDLNEQNNTTKVMNCEDKNG